MDNPALRKLDSDVVQLLVRTVGKLGKVQHSLEKIEGEVLSLLKAANITLPADPFLRRKPRRVIKISSRELYAAKKACQVMREDRLTFGGGSKMTSLVQYFLTIASLCEATGKREMHVNDEVSAGIATNSGVHTAARCKLGRLKLIKCLSQKGIWQLTRRGCVAASLLRPKGGNEKAA